MGAVSKGPGGGGVDSYPNTLSPQSFGPGKQNDLKKETKARLRTKASSPFSGPPGLWIHVG